MAGAGPGRGGGAGRRQLLAAKRKRNSELLSTLFVLSPEMGRMIKSG